MAASAAAAPNASGNAADGTSAAGAFVPQRFGEIVVYSCGAEKGSAMPIASMLEDSPASLSSKSLHYGASAFEGAKVVVHRNAQGGAHRLYLLHYDWNVSRLNFTARACGFGSPPISDEDHMLMLVNALYANGWDASVPRAFDERRTPVGEMYVRPILYLPQADNITLRNSQPFSFSLIVSPQLPYHGAQGPQGMALLLVPEPRRLAAPEQKRADNYPNSMVWVQRMNYVKEWIGKSEPDIFYYESPTSEGRLICGSQAESLRAAIQGALREVLFQNEKGEITEGSAENVAIVKEGSFLTPPLSSGCLPGFTMQKTELIAEKIGLEARREPFGIGQFLAADLAILTGNASGAVQVKWVVDCGWEVRGSEWKPALPLRVYSVGTKSGEPIYKKILEEQRLILAGKSELGKFGVYADEFLSARDIAEIRERTSELVRLAREKKSQLAASMQSPAFEANTSLRMKTRLFGSAPPGFRSRLAGGELRYAQMLNIR